MKTSIVLFTSLAIVTASHDGVLDHSELGKRARGRFGGFRNAVNNQATAGVGGDNNFNLDAASQAGVGQAGVAAAAAKVGTAAAVTIGKSTATANNRDPQNSLTLDSSQAQPGLTLDGQQVPAKDQVSSATSGNNFINFCLTRSDLPLTNGAQVKTGSCNPTVMGVIAAQTRMPSSKFSNPPNGATIAANTDFTITMNINNLVTGNFVNAQANYFAAPQNTDSSGKIIGHSHVVIEAISSLGSTTASDPTSFAFFKGLNTAAVNGVLSANVAGGLPAGTYKMSSINTAANHQPALVAVAQHGSLDDAVYFTVAGGNAQTGGGKANSGSVIGGVNNGGVNNGGINNGGTRNGGVAGTNNTVIGGVNSTKVAPTAGRNTSFTVNNTGSAGKSILPRCAAPSILSKRLAAMEAAMEVELD